MKDILLLKNNGWKLRVDFLPGTGGIWFVQKGRLNGMNKKTA